MEEKLYVIHGFLVKRKEIVVDAENRVVSVSLGEGRPFCDLSDPVPFEELRLYEPAQIKEQ